MAHFGQQGLPVSIPDCTGGGVITLLVHPHLPNHLGFLLLDPPPPNMQVFLPGGLVPQGVGGQTVVPLPDTGIASLCLLDSAHHAFAVALQGVVVSGFSTTVSSISPYSPMGKVATLSLLNL